MEPQVRIAIDTDVANTKKQRARGLTVALDAKLLAARDEIATTA